MADAYNPTTFGNVVQHIIDKVDLSFDEKNLLTHIARHTVAWGKDAAYIPAKVLPFAKPYRLKLINGLKERNILEVKRTSKMTWYKLTNKIIPSRSLEYIKSGTHVTEKTTASAGPTIDPGMLEMMEKNNAR